MHYGTVHGFPKGGQVRRFLLLYLQKEDVASI
jgi:hypothetical protein